MTGTQVKYCPLQWRRLLTSPLTLKRSRFVRTNIWKHFIRIFTAFKEEKENKTAEVKLYFYRFYLYQQLCDRAQHKKDAALITHSVLLWSRTFVCLMWRQSKAKPILTWAGIVDVSFYTLAFSRRLSLFVTDTCKLTLAPSGRCLQLVVSSLWETDVS